MQQRSDESLAVERVSLIPGSPWWGEHRSRYHFAGRFVAGQKVLDIACGTGFGGPILLNAKAASVLGIDISREGLEEARRELSDRYYLCQADGTRLPLRDNSIEVITSFETLEHTPFYRELLGEFRRVLMPEGVLILSTPNALYTKPVDGKPLNPFHVREFTPLELREMLSSCFSRVELLGQRTHPRYRICPHWELPENLPRDLASRLKVVAWKVQCRMPEPLREGISRLLWGRSFYPGEHDFIFAPEEVERGHVLVAVCRP
ncbi:MAG: methyltransferase domain-containing protein [Acidobacteriota bacterium]|nr:methyltransferase domain-containing protein [Acidobacteriota bacterium]